MSSEYQKSNLGRVLSFTNGRTCPERFDNGIFTVFGSNGQIGKTSKSNSPKNSIIIGRVGSFCGSVHFSTDPCWITDNAIRATVKENHNPFFIFYLLRHLKLNNWRSGSGQPLLNQETLNTIEVSVPSPFDQKAIGLFIWNLDKRIALLRETNTTLEAIAQALFKSWFMDFDPVRAKQEGREPEGMDADTAALFPDSFEESELGLIPKGWKIGKVDNILSRLSAKVRYTKDQIITDGVIPIYEQGAGILLGYLNGPAQFLADERNPAFIFGDHTCVTHLSCEPFDISQNVIPLKGKDRATLWVYYAVKDKQAFQEYRRHWMELIVKDIVIPTPQICEAYANIVSIYHLKMESNVHQLRTITSIRDTLLPRLISGQLRIPEAEALFEETTV